MTETVKLSKVEDIKSLSRGLRGGIADAVATNADMVSDDDQQLLKFHGSYGQYDRDTATARKKQGLDKEHMFMIRARIPGGRLTRDQYLAFDEISQTYADGSLRVTTRQTIQLHGVIGAQTLKNTIQELNDRVVTTLATCGDVVRNVTTSPAPKTDAVYKRLEADARLISTHFLPKSTGYTEIWLDGEKLEAEAAPVEEPIYGPTYLPRKFKIGLTIPEDNVIDVLSNDLAIIAIFDGDELQGYNFYVGGGGGMTHNKPATYARVATSMAFFTPDELIPAVEAVVKFQRDHGDRTNRKHARLKYVVQENGLEFVRKKVGEYFGRPLRGPRPHKAFTVPDHLTWNKQGDGNWYLGLPVHSGRIADFDTVKLRSAMLKVVSEFDLNVVLSPNQDVILADVKPQDRFKVAQVLREHNVGLAADTSALQRWALACPALPTCGLALSEAERVKEPLIAQIEGRYNQAGLAGEPVSIRITGCPNGCARPYSSEIGIVGRMPGHYALFVGGAWDGTRLNRKVADRVAEDQVAQALAPLFELYAKERQPGQRFGDFIHARPAAEVDKLVFDAIGEKAFGGKLAEDGNGEFVPVRLTPPTLEEILSVPNQAVSRKPDPKPEHFAGGSAEADTADAGGTPVLQARLEETRKLALVARQKSDAARAEAVAERRRAEDARREADVALRDAEVLRATVEAERGLVAKQREEVETLRVQAEDARRAVEDIELKLGDELRAAEEARADADRLAEEARAEKADAARQVEEAATARRKAEEDRRRSDEDRRRSDEDRRRAEEDRRDTLERLRKAEEELEQLKAAAAKPARRTTRRKADDKSEAAE